MEVAKLVAPPERRLAADPPVAAVRAPAAQPREVQVHAAHQDRPDRHQHQRRRHPRQGDGDDHALVAAVEARHTRQRRRVHVPGVARDVTHRRHAAVIRRVEPVVHRRGEPDRDVVAIAAARREVGVLQQIVERVGESLGLDEGRVGDVTGGDDDAVARAHDDAGAGVDGPWRRVSGRA